MQSLTYGAFMSNGGATRADLHWAFRHPGKALVMASLLKVAEYQALHAMNSGQVPGPCHNGACDAVRHATASCMWTTVFGAGVARTVGMSHETAPQQPNEAVMDRHNNGVGRTMTSWGGGCIGNAISEYNAGNLVVIRAGHLASR
jgi:hypothetical protein